MYNSKDQSANKVSQDPIVDTPYTELESIGIKLINSNEQYYNLLIDLIRITEKLEVSEPVKTTEGYTKDSSLNNGLLFDITKHLNSFDNYNAILSYHVNKLSRLV